MTFRALLRLSILQYGRYGEHIPDLVRVLKPYCIPQGLETLIESSDLICSLLKERVRCDNAKRKIRAKTLKEHFNHYRGQVEAFLARQDCVYFPGIRNAVHTMILKASTLIEADRLGTNVVHVETLSELHVYLECVRVSAFLSFGKNCPQIEALCRKFAHEFLPTSELAFLP